MKEYLLLIWILGTAPTGNAVQVTMVTRQQCYSVVETYRDLQSPIRVSCFPPHAKYSTGGVAKVIHSWDRPGGQPPGDDEELPQRRPDLSSGPDDDRKAP
jgi:hypothetical protein